MGKLGTDASFGKLVGEVCDKFGSVAEAARRAGVDRGWLSKVIRGSERPPSFERLDVMISRWGLSDEAHVRLRTAAVWEKANPAARELLAQSGIAGHPSARTRLTLFMTPADAGKELYRDYVPIEGSYSASAGILPMPDSIRDGEREYLAFGPVPKGSVAVRLDEAVEGFPARSFIVFGPVVAAPRGGMGLFRVKGDPADVIARFEADARSATLLGEHGSARVPAGNILQIRLFVAVV